MISSTQKIIAPVSKAEVEIKDWITGADAEYIYNALDGAVEIKTDFANKTAQAGKFNAEKALGDEAHRAIEKFIVAVNSETTNVLATVLELPEEDYDFIKSEIATRRGKKKPTEDIQSPQ